MLRIGLLGCGRIGVVHAGSIRALDSATVVAVADAVPSAAEALARDTGAEVRSAEAILAADDIDAVVIGTPTDTHYDLIHGAAKNGKAIFCEKPIDMSVDRIRACIDAVGAAGVPFMTGFNRRFDPNFAAMRSRIAAGDIGAVELATITSRDPAPPPVSYIARSGGLFRDMMIHDFDIARWLVGEEFTTVKAFGSNLVDPAIGAAGDVDTAVVSMTTQSGKLASISNSRRASYGYDQRIEVHGTKGMIQAQNVLESTVVTSTETGVRSEKPMHFFLERYAAAYQTEWDGFVRLVLDGDASMPNQHDGLASLRLAEEASAQVL